MWLGPNCLLQIRGRFEADFHCISLTGSVDQDSVNHRLTAQLDYFAYEESRNLSLSALGLHQTRELHLRICEINLSNIEMRTPSLRLMQGFRLLWLIRIRCVNPNPRLNCLCSAKITLTPGLLTRPCEYRP